MSFSSYPGTMVCTQLQGVNDLSTSTAFSGNPMRSHSVKNYANIPQILDVPNLIQSQVESWAWLKSEGLQEVYHEVSPIVDYTSKKYELHFLDHYFRDPKYSPTECK